MDFDCTFKDKGRQKIQEICVYEVIDGKITSEQYFY
ncbi:SnoaL-like domain-containing protein [Winogradskyella psychrotolerans]|nr:SnoaL-like domain-containing protein [Winogradskyella psychrotolerans]